MHSLPAIAAESLRALWRRRVAGVGLMLAGAVVVGFLPSLEAGTRPTLRWGLAAGFGALALWVMLAAVDEAGREARGGQWPLLALRPVARLTLLLGKWLALGVWLAVLVAVVGSGVAVRLDHPEPPREVRLPLARRAPDLQRVAPGGELGLVFPQPVPAGAEIWIEAVELEPVLPGQWYWDQVAVAAARRDPAAGRYVLRAMGPPGASLLTYRNTSAREVLLGPASPVVAAPAAGGFWLSYGCALALLWCLLAYLAAVGLACGAVLRSGPALLAGLGYLVLLGHLPLLSAGLRHHLEAGQVSAVGLALTAVVARAWPLDEITRGVAVLPAELLWHGGGLLLWSISLLALAALLSRLREPGLVAEP